jgi:dTDP-glucose 4,6-dehydratase
MKTILVTGGAGFIGSHFVDLLLRETNYQILVLDKLTYAGKSENMSSFINNSRVFFVKGDICDKEILDSLFKTYQIEFIVNFAAESHVDNSISNPDVFITSNIIGTYNLLNFARIYWKNSLDKRFIQISTDEVYGSAPIDLSFDEESMLRPNSPYSASKASGDMIARSFFVTYGLPVIITRSSNNYGPRQDSEKLIPKIINKMKNSEKIPIYGDGKNIRDWIYVEDNCQYIFHLLKIGLPGEIYNISTRNELSNLEVVNLLGSLMQIDVNIDFIEDRLGHDFRYSINNDKLSQLIDILKLTNFKQGLEKTADYYLKK